MLRDRFSQRKKSVLFKSDKSSKGKWDEKVKILCDKINLLDDFYTTSSCSGRIILMIEKEKKEENSFLKVWHNKISFNILKEVLYDLSKRKELIKFKLEPPIIHVSCRTLEGASEILEKARSSGFKRSSMIAYGKNIFIELNSTEKLEFPIIKNGKILVDDSFLKLIIDISNKKLEKGWVKIKNLERKIR